MRGCCGWSVSAFQVVQNLAFMLGFQILQILCKSLRELEAAESPSVCRVSLHVLK